ncbi:hypothetical protein LSAT2_000896 [Lamellibrachia satsuma]|nr:hypothetical protein LSAT2_000896 [Lamellibrachia satsuma]
MSTATSNVSVKIQINRESVTKTSNSHSIIVTTLSGNLGFISPDCFIALASVIEARGVWNARLTQNSSLRHQHSNFEPSLQDIPSWQFYVVTAWPPRYVQQR